MQAFYDHIDSSRERYLGELYEFVSRPSIAAQGIGIEPTAMWVAQRLERLGAEVRSSGCRSGARRVGLARHGARTLLVYDHYDVQPPEPLEGWTSPAFEPAERDGKLYARGVADNKSNLLLRIQALEIVAGQHGPAAAAGELSGRGRRRDRLGAPRRSFAARTPSCCRPTDVCGRPAAYRHRAAFDPLRRQGHLLCRACSANGQRRPALGQRHAGAERRLAPDLGTGDAERPRRARADPRLLRSPYARRQQPTSRRSKPSPTTTTCCWQISASPIS